MSSGFIYIMINPAFIKSVKIGLTTKTSELRAKELSNTSVPEDFIVVYDEIVNNCEKVEKELHNKFQGYRINKSREYFNVPLKTAIKELQSIAKKYAINENDIERISIFEELNNKYPNYLHKDIKEIYIAHINEVCLLESIKRPNLNLRDEIIERMDLSFIFIYDELMFPFTDSIIINARRFIEEFDPYSIIMCTDLFNDEAVKIIIKNYSMNHKEK